MRNKRVELLDRSVVLLSLHDKRLYVFTGVHQASSAMLSGNVFSFPDGVAHSQCPLVASPDTCIF